MPLTNASPHASTDVVLLSGPGSLLIISWNVDRSALRLPHERGVDPRHVRRSDVDAEVRDLESQRVGEVLDAGLCGVVRRQARDGGVGRQRRHDQHVAATVDHRRQRRPHGVEDADHVDVDQRPECRRIHVEHRTVGGDAGVGHYDVDSAEPLDALCRRRPASRPDRARRRSPSAPDLRRARRPPPSAALRRGRSSTSLAPLACSRRATSAPTPRAPPVMKTTFPFTEPIVAKRTPGVRSAGLALQRHTQQRVDGRCDRRRRFGVVATVLERVGGPTIQCGKGFGSVKVVG